MEEFSLHCGECGKDYVISVEPSKIEEWKKRFPLTQEGKRLSPCTECMNAWIENPD